MFVTSLVKYIEISQILYKSWILFKFNIMIRNMTCEVYMYSHIILQNSPPGIILVMGSANKKRCYNVT